MLYLLTAFLSFLWMLILFFPSWSTLTATFPNIPSQQRSHSCCTIKLLSADSGLSPRNLVISLRSPTWNWLQLPVDHILIAILKADLQAALQYSMTPGPRGPFHLIILAWVQTWLWNILDVTLNTWRALSRGQAVWSCSEPRDHLFRYFPSFGHI